MSTEIIYAARAIVVANGFIQLQIKSFSSNVSPKPQAHERKHASFGQFGRELDPRSPEDVASSLERLAREYDGGCYTENYRKISGPAAYSLWAKRIRRVAPSLIVRRPRLSRVDYGLRRVLCAHEMVPTLKAGDVIDVETAAVLVHAGVYPRMNTSGRKAVYLAFTADGAIYAGPKRAARRGWLADGKLAEDVIGCAACHAIATSNSGTHCIKASESGEPDKYLAEGYFSDLCTADQIARADSFGFSLYSESDATDACHRLAQRYPEIVWSVITRQEAVDIRTGALLLGPAE